MIRLCGFRISNYHNKVRIALLEMGVPHEEDEGIKPSQDEGLLARSPLGKVPFLEVDGAFLRESAVIMEYLEDAYPQVPLLPKDPLARAKVRELNTFIELHLELVVRPMYGMLAGGKPVSDERRQRVERDAAKGVRALKAVAKFDPFLAGRDLSIADCAAFVHLPLVTLVTKNFFGRDFLEELPQVKPYLKMLGERPAFAKVNEDRRAATAAAKK
jgi:glutathione S-transferase